MKHMFSVAILPAMLAGCAASYPAEVTPYRDPSDVAADIRPSPYISPVAGYHSRMPADPKPWRKLNEDASSEGGDAS